MNDNSSLPTLTFEPISNIRLIRMPGFPQPKDKLYKGSEGAIIRISERFVYKPRLKAGSAWKLYDGVTLPRKEDLIMVGNPDKRSSKLVYILADQAEYCILDLHEIPFVTVATTRDIISLPPRMHFGKQNNKFRFTFGSQGTTRQSHMPPQTPSISSMKLAFPQLQPRGQKFQLEITAATSYASQSGHTAQKRSRETAFGGEQDMEEIYRQHRRPAGLYSGWLFRVLKTFKFMD